jgi:ornithine--oxo-acid transaminase
MFYSTFGGNPLACRVATAALKVLVDEKLSENAQRQGERFRKEIAGFNSPIIQAVRGKGLLNAVVIDDKSSDKSYAWDICVRLANLGILCYFIPQYIFAS